MSEFSPVIATTPDNLRSTEILVRNYTPLNVKHSELRSIGRAEIDVVHIQVS